VNFQPFAAMSAFAVASSAYWLIDHEVKTRVSCVQTLYIITLFDASTSTKTFPALTVKSFGPAGAAGGGVMLGVDAGVGVAINYKVKVEGVHVEPPLSEYHK